MGKCWCFSLVLSKTQLRCRVRESQVLGREVHLVDETCVCVYDREHRCSACSTTQSPAIDLFRSDEV